MSENPVDCRSFPGPALREAAFEEIVNELGRRYKAVVVGAVVAMKHETDPREMVYTTHRGGHTLCLGTWNVGLRRMASEYDAINEARLMADQGGADPHD